MEEKSSIVKDEKVPFYKLFLFADRVDIALMTIGTFGAIGEGLTQPLMTLIFGQIINSFGGASSSNEVFHLVSEVLFLNKFRLNFFYVHQKNSIYKILFTIYTY